jgi:hypothetical protein
MDGRMDPDSERGWRMGIFPSEKDNGGHALSHRWRLNRTRVRPRAALTRTEGWKRREQDVALLLLSRIEVAVS